MMAGSPHHPHQMDSRSSLLAAMHAILAVPPTPDERAHPFSNSYSTALARLNTILNTTTQLNHALAQLLNAMPPSDQTSKLVSLMKQHTAISTSIALSRATTISLSAARRVVFPDSAPPSPLRLEEWGRAVGMEAFIDTSATSAATTVVMAGKVLVLDIDIDGGVVVKTSFAVGNNITNGTPAAPELDAFLARDIARWVDASKRASLAAPHSQSVEDPSLEAASIGVVIQAHLRYLMMLDSLASTEGERGIRWFIASVTAYHYFLDAQKLKGAKSQPLDKFLARNILPLLYLDTPSLSFLVWVSPLSYLRLLRSSPADQSHPSSPAIDIPITHITSSLSRDHSGATIARLKLVPSSEGVEASSQANFPNDHAFPDVPSHTWVLEFNHPPSSGHRPPNCGIVVSQSRMRAIQAVISSDISSDVLMGMGAPDGSSAGTGLGNLGPFASVGPVTGINMGNLGFNGFIMGPSHPQLIDSGGGAGSWVDLLLNNGSPSEYYKATFTSPSQAHPPLNVRLTAPQEPGFLLQEVPVKRASEVPRILDIVREQCWLNELLDMLQWQPESVNSLQPDRTSSSTPPPPISALESEEPVSAELLTSMLAGTVAPRSIPVTVYLPSTMLPPLVPTNSTTHFGLEGLGVGPPPISGSSTGGSLFGSTDIEMDMEIPGLSMSMNSGIDITMAGMGIELTSSPIPSRPSPMIVLSSPTRAPAMGMVELRVSFGDLNSKNGSMNSEYNLKVESSGGADTRGMDEVIRRGGIWGLPGRVWANAGPK